MPVVITGLGESAPLPAVSAFVEFGSALHVLRDPGHHGASGWAAGVRAAMSPRLAERTQAWWWTAQAIRAAPFVTADPPGDEFCSRLDRLRAMPAQQLARQLLRPISPSGDTGLVLRWSRSRGTGVADVVQALLAEPARAVDDFLLFLDTSWQEWFHADWESRRPVLAARSRQFADTVDRRGAVAALTTLDPSVTAAAAGAVITKIKSARYDVSGRGLLAVPSTLIRPHLYVADVPERPLLLIYPAEPGPPVPAAAELLRRVEVMRSLGRLEVARAIATEPRTAGEIAMLWNMDPTQVNRQLRALSRAGLARTTRRGRFVQYQLDSEAVAALGTDLLSLLLR